MLLTMWSCLFTNVSVPDTIEYVLNELSLENKLPSLLSTLNFKPSFLKLKTQNAFILNSKFYLQVDKFSIIRHSVSCFKTKQEKHD